MVEESALGQKNVARCVKRKGRVGRRLSEKAVVVDLMNVHYLAIFINYLKQGKCGPLVLRPPLLAGSSISILSS